MLFQLFNHSQSRPCRTIDSASAVVSVWSGAIERRGGALLGQVTRQDGASRGCGNSSKDRTRADFGFSSDIVAAHLFGRSDPSFKLLSKLQAGHQPHFISADDHVPGLNLDGRCCRTNFPDAFVDNLSTLPAPLRACEPNSVSPPVRERLCLLRDRSTSIANCRR